jgi:hypothetical protein
MIERNVPSGISLRAAGTITVSFGGPSLRYLAWLPFCETKWKPSRSSAFTIAAEECSLGELKGQPANFGRLDRGNYIVWRVLEVQLQCLLEVLQSLRLSRTKARDVDVQALSDVVLALAVDDVL